MSHLNRRFLTADSPHNYQPIPDTNHLRLVVGSSIISFLLVLLTLVYCFIRKLIRTSSTSSETPHQACNHHSGQDVLLRGLPVIVHDGKTDGGAFEMDCAICLDGYKDGEVLRTLPCDHVFHCACIDKWLLENGLCPVCRRVAVNMDQIRVENARRCSERLITTITPGGLGGGQALI